MSFREGVKQALKKAEDDLKQTKDDIKAFFKGTGTSRPSTPSGSQLYTGSFNVHERAGNHYSSLPATPLPAQVPPSPLLVTQLANTPDVDHRFEKPVQPSNLMREHYSGVGDSSTEAPVVSHLQVSKHASGDMVVDNDNSNFVSVEHSKPGQSSHEQLGEPPTRALKQLATEVVGQVVDTLKIGPLKDVSDLLQGFANMYKMEGAIKTEYEALQRRLQALLKVLEVHTEPSTSPMVASKVQGIREFIQSELNTLAKSSNKNQHGRLLTAQVDEERFVGCCRRIQEYMDRLSLDTSLSTWRLEDQNAKDRMSSWVRLLPSSPSAWYNSSAGRDLNRRECTSGTRVDVLANLLAWANGSSKDTVYWLNGMAGTGKTTIAYSVCTELADRHKLGASFFCSRLREECGDVNRIIPSIAYQLAQFSASFQLALSAVMEKDQDAHHKVLNEQFETLIRKPLLAALATQPLTSHQMVVVIDALDECKNKESTRDILDVLLVKSADLPIKFVVSSRPEPQIRDQMKDDRIKSKLVLHELHTGNVHADIETYIREELKPMEPSPTELQFQALVKKAGILFIYAATAVRYVGFDNFQSDPEDRLRIILAGSESQEDGENEEIDDLYITVLDAALGNLRLRKVERDTMRQVLHTVVCARDPLTVSGLSELLQIHNTGRVRAVLRPLWSVLHVVGGSELVTTLHASFPDFMFNRARSRAYHCESDTHNRILAEHCLERIKRALPPFNICGLESSYLPDDKVPNIRKRVADTISSDLLYACRYWSDHVETGQCASTQAIRVREFLSTRLLLWMEVLNLTKHMRTGVMCMKRVVGWCSLLNGDEELVELSNDALRFVDTFTSNPVSQATTHIYLSMLTFWPISGPIAKHYSQFAHGPIQAEGTALDQRQPAYLATWKFTGAIDSMAVSKDGRLIALGIERDVLVADSSSGQVVLGPLDGHSDSISTLMFSPDHTRIFAGLFDRDDETATIIAWDTRTGHTVIGPLQLDGHTNSITCLTLSPDCTCIATGCYDLTVRVWDAENGKVLCCLKTDGTGGVLDFAFSPNSKFIAAGMDEALQVWNSQTGETTLGPLRTEKVDMIAFSPDSSRIIHAQRYNNTVHMRDAQNGQLIHELNLGNQINGIGYSPDGRHIVTGHYQSIQVWVAQNGEMTLGPLVGHTNWVCAITFSPDGSRIMSACNDGLVCTWDPQQHNLAPNSVIMRISDILLTGFSPDGQHFVSGSESGSLHIWDSHTGAMTAGPITPHTTEIIGINLLNDRVVSGFEDGMITVYNAMSGEVLHSFTVAPGYDIRHIAFSSNGDLIATVSYIDSSPEINLWDAQTGTKVLGPLTVVKSNISLVQFSPAGTRIVACSWGRTSQIVVWDVSDGRNLFGSLDGHTSYVYSVSHSPNNALIASGSDDKTIIVWDAYTGSKVLDPLVGHSSAVYSVHFSPDSTRIISGSHDKTIRIWDAQTGEMLFELLHGHKQSIRSVAYSADGVQILSRSEDRSVRIHDARSPKERVSQFVLSYVAHSNLTDPPFTCTGTIALYNRTL
ncbi:putative vegetative incompatibility protein HET-E-1 [Rhizoctonia solani 123E]|uniref:Putative vegetative incompatibility protein HET-E-1 n=1 Tax=Rhizoctonia solani 123E TaxID=1423351 RepID=A0A074RRR4_9AGAM|nr:putative vegetative incompatibility protein HET-E-1 [Rhizoctonia solani 123E]